MPVQELASNNQKNYARFASNYDRVRGVRFQYVERHTVLSQLPELQGRDVLDMACGTGLYTRWFRSLGASRVTGVDISAEMIEVAQQQEKEGCSVIEYVQQDILQWMPEHRYDLVFSAFILNYAQSRKQLQTMLVRMCEGLAANGRLIIILNIFGKRSAPEFKDNVLYHDKPLQPYESFRLTLRDRGCDEAVIDIFPTCIEPVEVFALLSEMGFNGIHCQPPLFSPEASEHMDAKEICQMAIYPTFMVISATRPDV